MPGGAGAHAPPPPWDAGRRGGEYSTAAPAASLRTACRKERRWGAGVGRCGRRGALADMRGSGGGGLFQEAAAQICAAQAEALRTRMKLKGAGLRGGAEAGESGGDAIVNVRGRRRGAVEDRLQVRGVSTLWQQPPRV
eukprot:COSAG01_NODE_1200_length_11277_cov_59.330739_12_plen_138_part_00